jgi:hypothetical protein
MDDTCRPKTTTWKTILYAYLTGILSAYRSLIEVDTEAVQLFQSIYRELKHHHYTLFVKFFHVILKQIISEPLEREHWGIRVNRYLDLSITTETVKLLLDTYKEHKDSFTLINGEIQWDDTKIYWKLRNPDSRTSEADQHLHREIISAYLWKHVYNAY